MRRRGIHSHNAAMLLVAAFCLLTAGPTRGQGTSRVQLLTVTRGDGLFTTFGHTVLRLVDDGAGTDRVYDWGTYDPADPMLAPKFFVGELLYTLDTATTPIALRMFDSWFGGVVAQDLALTPAQTARLEARIAAAFSSGDRSYRYHYFDDNCTTRVRDLLDDVLDGALSAATRAAPADDDTYRTLIEGSLPDAPVVRWAVYGMLNERIDVPVDRWQRMFLPAWLMAELDGLRVPGPDGTLRPLVAQRSLLQGQPPVVPLPAPSVVPWLALVVVLLLGGALPGIAPGRRPARVFAAIWIATLCLVGGFHGSLQALAWTIAPYAESHANANLLAVHPLTLALVVLGPLAVAGRTWALRSVRIALLVQIAVLAAALALRAAGVLVQHVEGFAVPVMAAAAGLWWSLGRLQAKRGAAPEPRAGSGRTSAAASG